MSEPTSHESRGGRAAPANAFKLDFLRDLAETDDDAPGMEEAIHSGDWDVHPLSDGRFGVFRGWQRPPFGDPPGGLFAKRSWALLAAAILPTLGREQTLRFGEEDGSPGMPLVAWGEGSGLEIAGVVPAHDSAFLEGLETGSRLGRLPWSLALILEAAGTETIGLVGQILYQRMARPRRPPPRRG